MDSQCWEINLLKESVILVQIGNTEALLDSMLGDKYDLIATQSTEETLEICRNNKQHIASIVLGSEIKDPIQASQRLHGIKKDISVIILASKENLRPLQKSISFTPLLGSSTVCMSEDNLHGLEDELLKIITNFIKLRESRKVSQKLNFQLNKIVSEKQKVLTTSKEYLERLFDSAPIGIMTLNAEGNFLALNKAASDMFGITERQSIGLSIKDVLPQIDLTGETIVSISTLIRNQERHFEITITPVQGQDESDGYLLMAMDVTDRNSYEKALEQAVKARDEFLSIASHELKTPITSLKLQLQMAKRAIKPEDLAQSPTMLKIAKSTDIAINQVQRLVALVEDLLDVSKIESGKMDLKITKVKVVDLLNENIERLSQHAYSAKCSVQLEAPEDLVIMTDPFRLDQIVTNLLMNAFKYASGSPVKIKVTEVGESVQFTVQDYGMGIKASKIDMIFNRFERGISHNNISGLGLGLYICKSLVEILGGTIWVESSPGHGASFIFILPKARAA